MRPDNDFDNVSFEEETSIFRQNTILCLCRAKNSTLVRKWVADYDCKPLELEKSQQHFVFICLTQKLPPGSSG